MTRPEPLIDPGGPPCLHCGTEAVLTSGREVYPHRADLHCKPIWICRGCGAYCGCHPGTEDPLGRPANAPCGLVRDWVPACWRAFEDYRLGAVQLSGPAMACLRRMLAGETVYQEESGMSKGEWREFQEALKGKA